MYVNEKMYELGSKKSAIRELFEYGKKKAKEVGAENVYDFSLGNPTVPAPECVNETIRELTNELDSISLHGYTSAQGDEATRKAIADYLNKTYDTHFNPDNFYMTCGAAASLTITLNALVSNPEDEVIAIAPFFPEYRVFATAAGAKFVVVSADTEKFQIKFDELERIPRQLLLIHLIILQVLYIQRTQSRNWQHFWKRKRKNMEQVYLLYAMNHTEKSYMMG